MQWELLLLLRFQRLTPHRSLLSLFTRSLCAHSTLSPLHSVLCTLCALHPTPRGIANGVLPKEFFEADADSGVRGAIETGFMSTSTSREVALSYAGGSEAAGGHAGGDASGDAGGGKAARAGNVATVLEIQTGMVDRGANLSWLSQYPAEAEMLFAPLAGLEVISTRVEGSVLVVEMRVAVNLMSLTIEQAVSKRRKVVWDMAANMRAELVHEVQGRSWEALRALVPDAGARARQALDEQLLSVTSEPPEFFNNDDKLGGAIKGAVDAKSFVSRWPLLLLDSVSPMQRAQVGDQRLLERYLSHSDKLVRSCDPERGGTPLLELQHGINPVLAHLSLASRLRELALIGNRLTDAHLRALCGALKLNDSARLTFLTLENNRLTSVEPLVALLPGCLSELRRLDLGRNKLKADAIKALADALPNARQLRRLDLTLQTNFLSMEAAEYLAGAAEACATSDAAAAGTWPEATGHALIVAAREGRLADDPAATFVAVAPSEEGLLDGGPSNGGSEARGGDGGASSSSDEPLQQQQQQQRQRLVKYGGVPVFDGPLLNGGISLCGPRLNGPDLVLREMKLPALNDADVCLIAASVRLLGAAWSLSKIDLSGNKLASPGVVILMRALAATPAKQLRSLSLANNAINRTGVEAVAAALHAFDLVDLALGYSYVGSTHEGMSALGGALEHAPNLEVLALQRCDMTSHSLSSLVGGLQGKAPRLRRLLLDSNIKSAHGYGDVLRACPALEVLSIQNCALSDASDLITALEDLDAAPKLAEIALGANSISEDSLLALREAAAKRAGSLASSGLTLSNADDQSNFNSTLVAESRRQERIEDAASSVRRPR